MNVLLNPAMSYIKKNVSSKLFELIFKVIPNNSTKDIYLNELES